MTTMECIFCHVLYEATMYTDAETGELEPANVNICQECSEQIQSALRRAIAAVDRHNKN